MVDLSVRDTVLRLFFYQSHDNLMRVARKALATIGHIMTVEAQLLSPTLHT